MAPLPTVKVKWPEQFGEDVMIMNASDFDPEKHELIEGEVPGYDPKSPFEKVYDAITAMHEEDPDKTNGDWWLAKNGAPELKELRRRVPNVKVTGEMRDSAYATYTEANDGGAE